MALPRFFCFGYVIENTRVQSEAQFCGNEEEASWFFCLNLFVERSSSCAGNTSYLACEVSLGNSAYACVYTDEAGEVNPA